MTDLERDHCAKNISESLISILKGSSDTLKRQDVLNCAGVISPDELASLLERNLKIFFAGQLSERKNATSAYGSITELLDSEVFSDEPQFSDDEDSPVGVMLNQCVPQLPRGCIVDLGTFREIDSADHVDCFSQESDCSDEPSCVSHMDCFSQDSANSSFSSTSDNNNDSCFSQECQSEAVCEAVPDITPFSPIVAMKTRSQMHYGYNVQLKPDDFSSNPGNPSMNCMGTIEPSHGDYFSQDED